MAFGNPYRDLWSIERLVEAVRGIAALDVGAISLADTIGVADADDTGDGFGSKLHESVTDVFNPDRVARET